MNDHTGELTIWAPAKLNLTLEVIGRRSDGYHEIRSIMCTICLADRLRVTPADDLFFTCSDPSLQSAENLVVRAARLLRQRFGVVQGARLHLDKHIPLAAGLGGGSSDAAAALVTLNRLWRLGCSTSDLSGLAAQLGSDVPFFVTMSTGGGTALAFGRGEEIVSLPSAPAWWVVLALPIRMQENKTASMYRSLTTDDYADGSATAQVVEALRERHVPPDDLFVNSFLGPAGRLAPIVAETYGLMAQLNLFAHLTGSGPTLFALLDDRNAARAATAGLRARGVSALLTRICPG